MGAEQIQISVKTVYIPAQSEPEQNRYVFAYTITIRNNGDQAMQLLHRHWLITDAEGKETEVEGPGVVGQQPDILPGSAFEYTSGTVLDTPLGVMQGSYTMQSKDNALHQISIPAFRLALPNILH
ncbi:Co2+/Mg2+ efflux protein ApaG [Motilimonas sp. E26]|nr:Co2+/Mg2+ efflux protein ApaG [Motilimonas sp. E26]MCE0559205.1 Co2+/Mg2+ efflux protein ApaG [Motilimonas sp. E26]